jgi:alanine racemase
MAGHLERMLTRAMDDDDIAGGRLTIDLDAVAANHALLAGLAAPARCAAVVKADAYGLGAIPVVRTLVAAGCRDFFVAHLSEALEIAGELSATARLFVLNGLTDGAEPQAAATGAVPVLNATGQARRWQALGERLGRRLPAAVQIDSGMSRLGLSPDDAAALADDPRFRRWVEPILVMSHLACSDDPADPANIAQLRAFEATVPLFPGVPRSLANSGGVFLSGDFAMDLVRPGIAHYGGAPNGAATNPMRPTVRLKARVIQQRTVPAGVGVGYGLTFRTDVPCRLATLSVGYADGWPRRLGNRGAAWRDGVRLPIVGRVSMDSMMVDVGALDEGALADGDWVDLIGADQSIDAVAADADTISYELLTSLGRRYQRIYLGGPDAGRLAGAGDGS